MTAPHPATAALRGRNRAAWHAALVADLRSGEPDWRQDDRDLLVHLAPYHDCARRLGMPVGVAFRLAAWRGPSGVRGPATAFGRRRDVTLEAFGWIVARTADGPAYVSTRAAIDTERSTRVFGR